MRQLLLDVAERSADYLEGLPERRVAPSAEALEALSWLGGELPDGPTDPAEVVALLDEVGSPATVASAGPRYFGFVTGGSLPAAVAADWLGTAWDTNGGPRASSPVSAVIEEVALEWLVDVLGLPSGTGGGFVTGATMANFTGLCAARSALLRRTGWDVDRQGLFGAPELRVVVGEEVHVSLLKALGLAGLGRDRVERVPVDGQGRMRPRRAASARRPHDPLPAGREREHRRGRSDGGAGRRGPGSGRVGPRRWRLWHVGRGRSGAPIAGRWDRRRRLVGDRRAQVAQRPVRQRAGLRPRP
jgi:hypothetical protein